MVTDLFLFLEPRIGAQPKHVVVGKARTAKRPGQHHLLLGRWVKTESVSALDLHSATLYKMCKFNHPFDSFAAALYLPGLKAGVSREVN